MVQGETGGVSSWLRERRRRSQQRLTVAEFVSHVRAFDPATKAHLIRLVKDPSLMREALDKAATREGFLSALSAIEACFEVESERAEFHATVMSWAEVAFHDTAPGYIHFLYEQQNTQHEQNLEQHATTQELLRTLRGSVDALRAPTAALAPPLPGNPDLERIRQYLKDGMVELAREHFAALPATVDEEGGDPKTRFEYHVLRGSILALDSKAEEAADAFETALRFDRDSPRALYYNAHARRVRGDHAGALALVELALAKDERMDAALALKAGSLAALGRSRELEPLFELASKATPELGATLARAALNAGEPGRAEALVRRILGEGSPDPRFPLLLARALYERLGSVSSGGALSREEATGELADAASAAADAAIAALERKQLDGFMVEALSIRQSLRLLLEDFRGAEEDGRRALGLNTNLDLDPVRRAQFIACLRLERPEEAARQLRELRHPQPDDDGARIMCAESFLEARRPEEALGLCNEVLAGATAGDLVRANARLLAAKALRASGREREVEGVLAAATEAEAATGLIDVARAESALEGGDAEGMRRHFRAALGLAGDAQKAQVAYDFARALRAVGAVQEASDVLAPIAAADAPAWVLELAADVAFHAGSLARATSAVKLLRAQGAPEEPHFVRIEAFAAQDAGDLERAVERYGALTALAPNEPWYGLEFAQILLRHHQPGAAKHELERVEALPMRPEAMDGLARVWLAADEPERALPWAYRALRAEYGNPDRHMLFFNACMAQPGAGRPAVKLVAEETAVLLRFDDGAEQWHFITSAPDLDPARNELHPSNPLAARLLGLPVSSRIVVDDRPLRPVMATVAEIQDAYLYAFRQSSEAFGRMFPGDGRLLMMRVNDEDPGSFLEEVVHALSGNREHHDAIESAVVSNYAPRAVIAHLDGKDVYDGLRYHLFSPGFEWRCATLEDAETEAANRALAGRAAVVDLDALLTLRALGLLEEAAEDLALTVPQHTVDALERKLRDLASKPPHMTLGLAPDAKLFREEVDSAALEAEREGLESLLGFLRARVRVVSVESLGEIDPERRRVLETGLPLSTLATLYAARQHGLPLYAEDVYLRLMAWHHEPGGVPGFATVHWLTERASKGALALDGFTDALAAMAGWDFRLLPVYPHVLENAFLRDQAVTGQRCRALLRALGRGGYHLDFRAAGLARLALAVWRTLFALKEEALEFALDAAFVDANPTQAAGRFIAQVRSIFRLASPWMTEIERTAVRWAHRRIWPGV